MTGGENVGEGKAGEAEAVQEAGDWKLAWTAAINGLLWLSFFIGMSFIGVVHQVGWMAASEEPNIIVKNGGPNIGFTAQNLWAYLKMEEQEGEGFEAAIRDARNQPFLKRMVQPFEPEDARGFALIDSNGVCRGSIVFLSNYSNPRDGRIGVYDVRMKHKGQLLERDELPELMRRYQDELRHVF